MPKPELKPSVSGIRAHLNGKVEEWIATAMWEGEPYETVEQAEQDFKDWLWGTSHGSR